MRKILLGFCLFILYFFSFAQTGFTISGKVINEKGEPVARAFIHLLNTPVTVLSDSSGSFVISGLFTGNYKMEIKESGHADKIINLPVNESSNLIITLPYDYKQLNEVIVTAEKREELMKDIPAAISVINSKQAEQFRIWNINELTAMSPNLYIANPGDGRNVTSIRGIVSSSYDPAVATYVDGVNQFSLDTYISELLDIERIEILRGPQGTLYGRNSMGGAINIITKNPSNATKAFTEINLGNRGFKKIVAGINSPLIKDKLFFRVASSYTANDGAYKNIFNNSSYDQQHHFSFNSFLKWVINSKWSASLNIKEQFNRNSGAFPLIFGVQQALSKPFVLNQDATTTMVDNVNNSSLQFNFSNNHFNFESISSYQSDYRYYRAPLDGDFSSLDGISIYNHYGDKWNNVKVLTQEFRFNSADQYNKKWKWAAGSYLFYQHNPVKQATMFGKQATLFGAPDSLFSIINTSKGNNSGLAFYGQVQYSLIRRLDLIAGLRYDYEKKRLAVMSEYQKDTYHNFLKPDTTAAASYNVFSPKVEVVYHFSSTTNFYFNYSRGFRAGGLTQIASDPSQPPLYPYQPEFSNNFEIGMKNDLFNKNLYLNFSMFHTVITNAQIPVLILPDAITVTKNTGKLKSKGVEAELTANIFKSLFINYSFGYTNARYEKLQASANGQQIELENKSQIFTPCITSMLSLKHEMPLNATKKIRLQTTLQWAYTGEEYFDLANTMRQSPHHLLNAGIGILLKKYRLTLWSKNLTNATYIDYGYDFGAVHLANPRSYGLTINITL